MHDLLGLEYINSTMCHYMKTEGGEAEEFPMLHYILFSLSSQEKNTMFHSISLFCEKRCVRLCVRAYKRREGRRYERTCLIALFKCHFTAG